MGKRRVDAAAPRVAELNSYVPITILESESLADDLPQLKRFQVIVLTRTSLEDQLTISDFCHQNGIYIVIADTFGLSGYLFNDFGEKFTVVDVTGEDPVSGIVADIDETGLVSVLDETRHGLEDGDYVTFTEIKGMEELNNCCQRSLYILNW